MSDQVMDEESAGEKFRGYWNSIPVLKRFENEETYNILDQEIRRTIIDILADGVEVEVPGTTETARLHVLSASQINDVLNKRLEDSVNKSNLYFHLQKLEDNELITTVGVIQNGRRFTSYFGRTARVYILDVPTKENKPNFLDEEEDFVQLITEINPDTDKDTIIDVIKRAKSLYGDHNKQPIKEWIEEYENQLRQSNIDIKSLYGLLHKIIVFNPSTVEALQDFAKLLKFSEYFD